ncbi:MAG: SHOCT domain-containing protein [Bacteroidota bacterium]
MSNQVRSFRAPGVQIDNLVDGLRRWLYLDGYRSQAHVLEDGRTVVQITQKGEWRKIVGMSTALNVVFTQDQDALYLEIGEGKWIDKIAGGAIGLWLFPPLALTNAVGMWNQSQMPGRIMDYVYDYLQAGSSYHTSYEEVDIYQEEEEEPFLSKKPRKPVEEEKDPLDDLFVKLEKLGQLKEKGILTEEEFLQQKQKLLDAQ